VIDIVEVLIHRYAGRSTNELAASLGGDRKTLRNYLAPAEAAGSARAGRRLPRRTGAVWSVSGSRSWPTRGCGR
jgi:hypothetical protein